MENDPQSTISREYDTCVSVAHNSGNMVSTHLHAYEGFLYKMQ